MTDHIGLIVEDDPTTALDLSEILTSVGATSVVVDNKADALVLLQERKFCFMLLDLEIKGERDAIKGHIVHGQTLLRDARKHFSDHTGASYWLPILVISGFAREVQEAVDVMKDGASDIIHKPFNGRSVTDALSRALERSGRETHDRCAVGPSPNDVGFVEHLTISIPGDQEKRRTRVLLGSRVVMLPNASLETLLHLLLASLRARRVHKRELGAKDHEGFKGISVLREALRPALPEGTEVISNDYKGNYWLNGVTVGVCNIRNLSNTTAAIATLGNQIADLLGSARQKSDGNI